MIELPEMKQIEPAHWQIEFDQAEAKGVIDLYAGAYGLEIKVNGASLGLVDLFGESSSANDERGPQFVIDDGDSGNDCVGFVRMYPRGAVIQINDNAEEVGNRAFGYTNFPDELDNPNNQPYTGGYSYAAGNPE